MRRSSTFSSHVRRSAVPVLCAGLLCLVGWQAVTGSNGFLVLGSYKAEQARLAVEAEKLASERASLEHEVRLLGDRAEPDYAEEQVRRKLGLVRRDEVIVRLPD